MTGIALPDDATKANMDASTDDPKLARAELADLVDKFNALKDEIGSDRLQWPIELPGVAYASATSFTTTDTAACHVGRMVQISGTSTGTIRGPITAVSGSTITVSWATLSNETLSVWLGINSDGAEASIPQTRVNIRRFGARPGTGIDNTAAIQAAHDALPDSGGEIFVPRAFGGAAFADSSKYFCDSELVFTKPIQITGEGHDSSIVAYTGDSTTGAFIQQGTHQLVLKDVGILGIDGSGGEIYNPGSIGIKMQGLLKTYGTRIAKFEFGVEYNGGFYHKFINTEFDRNKNHLYNFNANNLSFVACRFSISEYILRCNAGQGPVTFTDCSLERFHTRAVQSDNSATFDVSLIGCYIENYPDATTESGIGGATDKYDSANFIQNGGDDGHVTVLGCMINTKGIVRFINHSGASESNITSLGNTIVVSNTAPDNTLTHYAFLGASAKVMAFDYAMGTPPAGGVYLSALTSGDEALYRDPFTGDPVTFFEEDWTEPVSLNNGWTNDGSAGMPDFGYYKDAQGRVHLKGLVDGGSSTAVTVYTLPSGYHPAAHHYTSSVTTSGTVVTIRVTASGAVNVELPATPTNVSLNNISFRAA